MGVIPLHVKESRRLREEAQQRFEKEQGRFFWLKVAAAPLLVAYAIGRLGYEAWKTRER